MRAVYVHTMPPPQAVALHAGVSRAPVWPNCCTPLGETTVPRGAAARSACRCCTVRDEQRVLSRGEIVDRLRILLIRIADLLTGPLSFRFILQPAVAILLGVRDGRLDAKAGEPPFALDIVLHFRTRKARLGQALRSTAIAISAGVVIDAVAQYLLFRNIFPAQALFVGTVIIALPYVLARGLTNRAVRHRRRDRGPGHAL